MNIEKFNNIYDLMKNGTFEEIKDILPKMIANIGTYCSTYFGEGSFGIVSMPAFGPVVQVKVGDENIHLSIVVKEEKSHVGNIHIDEYNDNLILSCDLNLTTEGIMLYILSKYWYDGINIHMPALVGVGACDKNRKGTMTHLIIEKCGLDKQIELSCKDRRLEPVKNIFIDKFVKWRTISKI